MGDIIRDAFQASGINNEMEKVIAETILQHWSGRNSRIDANEVTADFPPARDVDSDQNTLDRAKVRLITEQLWRRLERRYEAKRENWKKNETKRIDAMIENLRKEYKQNLDDIRLQYQEEMDRKMEEHMRKEEQLKNEVRLEHERRLLEVERAWNEVESKEKTIRITKEQLEAAKNNFEMMMANERMKLRREGEAIKRRGEELAEREENMESIIRDAVQNAEKRERIWILDKVKEWNEKESILKQKCDELCDKVRRLEVDKKTINEQSSRIAQLEAEISSLRGKLSESQTAPRVARERFPNYDATDDQTVGLKARNDAVMKQLNEKDAKIANLERHLKLVREAADLRCRELKIKHDIVADKLRKVSDQCRTYQSRLSESHVPKERTVSRHEATLKKTYDFWNATSSPSESLSSSSAPSSSFEKSALRRLESIDRLSHQIDVSLAFYRAQREAAEAAPFVAPQFLNTSHAEDSSFVVPVMTSTPNVKNIMINARSELQQLTPIRESTPERNFESSVLVPIALPLDKKQMMREPKQNYAEAEPSVVLPLHDAEGKPDQDELEESTLLAEPSPSTEAKNEAVVGSKRNSNEGIDPVMLQYMEIVKKQREREKTTSSQPQSNPPKLEASNLEDEAFSPDEAALEPLDTNADSDIDW